MTNYPESVETGARADGSLLDFAAALYREIPPRRPGRTPAGTPTVDDALAQVAADLLAEKGVTYTLASLQEFRKVAAWAAPETGGAPHPFPWASASWTAHREAWGKGESFAQFTADPATKRRVRERNGARTGDVPAAARAINTQPAEAVALVEHLTPEARRDLRERIDQAERFDHEAEVVAQGGRFPSLDEINAEVGTHPVDGILARRRDEAGFERASALQGQVLRLLDEHPPTSEQQVERVKAWAVALMDVAVGVRA